jgi:hypothetical protein
MTLPVVGVFMHLFFLRWLKLGWLSDTHWKLPSGAGWVNASKSLALAVLMSMQGGFGAITGEV